MAASIARHHLAALLAIAALAALLATALALNPRSGVHAQTHPPSCDSLTVPLASGFNLVGILNSTTPDALAPGASAVFGWDADAQQYDIWRRDVPPSLNTLQAVEAGTAAWIFVEDGGPTSVALPTAPQPARVAPMADGWNLATWTGPNATHVWDAFSPQAFGAQTIVQSPFIAAMTFDNPAQRFEIFDTRLPDALNDLTQLNFGDPVWLNLVVGLDWSIPASDLCDTGTTTGAASPLDGFLFDTTPVDLALVTAIGAPGQVRGNDYKGHGLFRVTDNDTTVVSPTTAVLYDGSRYIEGGTVQYLLAFRITLDLFFILDHILDPSPKVLAAFADAPEPLVDDSRTYPLIEQTFAPGDVVATAIGARATNNAFVDFGLYDLTRRTEASFAPDFPGDPTTPRDANPVCWYDLFGPDAEQIILPLVGSQSVEGATSDICPS